LPNLQHHSVSAAASSTRTMLMKVQFQAKLAGKKRKILHSRKHCERSRWIDPVLAEGFCVIYQCPDFGFITCHGAQLISCSPFTVAQGDKILYAGSMNCRAPIAGQNEVSHQLNQLFSRRIPRIVTRNKVVQNTGSSCIINFRALTAGKPQRILLCGHREFADRKTARNLHFAPIAAAASFAVSQQ